MRPRLQPTRARALMPESEKRTRTHLLKKLTKSTHFTENLLSRLNLENLLNFKIKVLYSLKIIQIFLLSCQLFPPYNNFLGKTPNKRYISFYNIVLSKVFTWRCFFAIGNSPMNFCNFDYEKLCLITIIIKTTQPFITSYFKFFPEK